MLLYCSQEFAQILLLILKQINIVSMWIVSELPLTIRDLLLIFSGPTQDRFWSKPGLKM